MKKKLYHLLSLLLIMVILTGTGGAIVAPSSAAKEEVVYVNLSNRGEAQNAHVVNAYELSSEGNIIDYGNYTNVSNLTTTEPITLENDMISVKAPKGRFYYQGDLAEFQLPWCISITYELNGKEVPPESLAGASGHLTLLTDIQKNPAGDSAFFENYALQITVTLNAELCQNIKSEGATIANAGKNKAITYTVLAGKEKKFSLTTDVTDFVMEGIQINGVSLSMDLDPPDDTEFTEMVNEMQSSVSSLNGGAIDLKNGARDFKSGLSQLSGQSSSLTEGSSAVVDGLGQLSAGVNQIKEQLPSTEQKPGQALSAASSEYLAGLEQLLTQIPESSPFYSTIAALLENYKQLDGGIQNLAQGFDAQSDAILQLSDGINTLNDQYASLDEGIKQYTQGVGRLSSGFGKLYSGISQLQDGTSAFQSGLSGVDTQISETIDTMLKEYTGGDFTVKSFVSEKNTDVKSVQFVMKTEGISKKTTDAPPVMEEKEPTLWERILGLFGIER